LLFFGQWWSELDGVQQVFWGIALIFSVLFVIQFVLSLVGLDFDGDADGDFSGHADVDTGYSLDADFTLLSVRSIIAFFTFFGWTGVIVLNGGHGTWAALGFASIAGMAAMFIVGYLMYLFSKLTQEGNVDIKEALYNTGEVYLTIPANRGGYGKIHVKVSGSYQELDAVTSGDALPTGSSIRIVEILDDNLLLVEQAKDYLTEESLKS
ncbi:MAG: hypothetical protein AAFV25_03660, partial [Bacteroidota bacterium]